MADTGSSVESIPFHCFCKLCNKLKTLKDAKKRSELLKKFFDKLLSSNPNTIFPILRLLLPQLDRERGPYGMKETNLARTYKRILSLPANSFEAERLVNFATPSAMSSGASGDFAEVVFYILRNRCGEGNEMTVGEVNRSLDNIAMKHAAHDPRGVDDEFTEMVQKMSNEEQKWLIRIIIKEMNIGLGVNKVLSLYHPDAIELYTLTNSISQVCSKLKNRSIRHHELEIELFQPFRPMLCERADVHTFSIKSPHYVETKFDGERFQLHYKDRKFKYFSRNGYEYSANYGEDPESGYFTSLVMKQFSSDLHSCVLDGEMMGWHRGREKFVIKAHNIDVKSLRVGSTIQPCFCAFDIIMYNDEILTNRPFSERIKILEKVFTPLDGVIMRVRRKEITTNEQVYEALNEAIDNSEEGIVLKQPDSVYRPNSRKHGWFKIKPDYSEGTVDLDLLIIGGYYGTGRKKGQICHFLLGVAGEESDSPGRFLSIARASSGLSDAELEQLGAQLAPHWIKFRPASPPPFLLLKREKPDVYITPRCSKILQVKSPEVVRTDAYYTGYTLRFVRVEAVRYDKLWSDCMWIGEFNRLRTSAGGKLTAGHVAPPAKRRRQGEPAPAPEPRVERLSELLAGKEVCVLSGDSGHSKEQLELMVRAHGGTVAHQPGSATFCIVHGTENIRVRNVIRARKHNVTRVGWLVETINRGELVPWDRHNLVSTDLRTEAALTLEYDCFGDSYCRPVSPQRLATILSTVPPLADSTQDQITEIDRLLFSGVSPFSLFRGFCVYFDLRTKERPSLKNAELIFKFLGGIVSSDLNQLVNYIVIDEEYLENLLKLDNQCKEEDCSCQFVSYRWIIDCFKNRKLEDNSIYMIDSISKR